MIKCCDNCKPSCDFCEHYAPLEGFINQGHCFRRNKKVECDGMCDKFECIGHPVDENIEDSNILTVILKFFKPKKH